MSKYSPEIKAAVLTALLTGQSISHVAKEYKIPVGTVKSWKSREINSNPQIQPVATEKNSTTLGEMILGLMEKEITAMQAIATAVMNPEWLKEQSAESVAVLYGVMSDKLFKKIEAIEQSNQRNAEHD